MSDYSWKSIAGVAFLGDDIISDPIIGSVITNG